MHLAIHGQTENSQIKLSIRLHHDHRPSDAQHVSEAPLPANGLTHRIRRHIAATDLPARPPALIAQGAIA
ncbi:hypothetical protein PhaeoP97_00221 [Phaeobacter porticola]|uniref:Uncharacterized protein n=1 Tax=Phaeobacter porticola TaxID=1844006 RepID=A0A1L3I0L7_9RHOB|nr:hypothetical protein PhaeoP97_00221 [Phaeobacter porticola]